MRLGKYSVFGLKSVLSLSLLTALVSVACFSQDTKTSAARDFQKYWSEFRAAAVKSDVEKVLSLTKLPFTTKGQLDRSKLSTHNVASFRQIFSKLMEQDVGLSAEPESMLHYIQRKSEVRAQGEQARIGQFVFERVQGRWMFVYAYLDEE